MTPLVPGGVGQMLRYSLTHSISLPSAQRSPSPVLLHSGMGLTPGCGVPSILSASYGSCTGIC